MRQRLDHNGIGPCAFIILPLVFFILLSSTSSFAAPREPLGRILAGAGKTEINVEGDSIWRPAITGMTIYRGDRARTGANSYLAIRYSDGSEIRISQNTVVVFTGRADQASPKGFLRVLTGMIWGRIRPGTPGRIITTPTTTVGIRGTEVNLETKSDGRVIFTLVEGEADFSNAQGSVILDGGSQSIAIPGTAPTPPRPVDVRSVIRWINKIPVRVTFQIQPFFPDPRARARAVLDARRTLLTNRNDLMASINLAQAAMDEGRPNQAVNILNRANRGVPPEPQLTKLLGLALWEAGRSNEARNMLNKAASLQADDAETQLYLGMLLDESGCIVEAEEAYSRAFSLAPEQPMVLRYLGLFRLNSGDIADAEKLFAAWLELDESNSDPLILLGLCCQLEGKNREAAAFYHRALALDSQAFKARFNLAAVMEAEGDLPGAIAQMQDARALAPLDPDVFNSLAVLLYKSGDRAAATEIFRNAAHIAPNDYRIWNNLGVVLAEQGRPLEAQFAFRKSAALNPTSAEPLYNQGLALQRAGNQKEAEQSFRLAIKRDPDMADALAQLGVLLLESGRREESRACLERGWKLDPASSVVLYGLGRWYQAVDQPLTAAAYFGRACQIQMGNARLLRAFIEAGTSPGVKDSSKLSLPEPIGELGSFGQVAGELLDQALKDNPNDSSIWNLKGLFMYRRGKHEEALNCFQAAVNYRPGNFEARSNLGQVNLELGQFPQAERELRRAISINPRYAPAHGNLGNLLLVRSEIEAAVLEYRKALALDPHLTDAWIGLGSALYLSGDLKGAIAANRKILEYAPADTKALGNLTYLLYHAGNVAEALEAGARAVVLAPDNGTLHYNYGWALFFSGGASLGLKQLAQAARLSPDTFEGNAAAALIALEGGDSDKCADLLSEALSIFPGFPDAWFLKGRLSELDQKTEDAMAYYKEALSSDPNHRDARQAIERLSGRQPRQ